MTIVIALLGLIFLIAIHEAGHMLTAKAFGVRVPEFGIGFGPAIFKKKIGSTVYSFRIILLGGFAKIAGMGGEDGSATGMERDRREETGEEYEARVRRLKEHPPPDTYYAKPAWQRALIIFAGPAVNMVFAVLIFGGLFTVQGIPTQLEAEVSAVAPNTMAEEVGLREGDRLIALDGEEISDWQGFQSEVANREVGDEVSVTYERDGQRQTVEGQLGAVPGPEGQEQRPIVGVNPVVSEVSHNPLLGLWEGVQRGVELTVLQVTGLFAIVTGQMNFFDNVTGPVGITTVGSEVISQGVYSGLTLMAIISLILGIMNLLPILPLDGGHLLFIAMEKIIRRPISEATMGRVAMVGLLLVLTLFLFATYADVSKLITGQPFIPDQ